MVLLHQQGGIWSGQLAASEGEYYYSNVSCCLSMVLPMQATSKADIYTNRFI